MANRIRSSLRLSVLCTPLALGLAAPLYAQSTPRSGDAPSVNASGTSDEDEADEQDIVVVGHRDPDAVIGDVPPENQLNPRDIRA